MGTGRESSSGSRVHDGVGRLLCQPEGSPDGFAVNDILPVSNSQGVHPLSDVHVFAGGPCQDLLGGVYGNVDIFFSMVESLGLGRPTAALKARQRAWH